MLARTISVLFALSATTYAQVNNPGLTASLDINLLQKAKDAYFDRILDIIRHVQIPDFSFDQGFVNGNTFTVMENSSNVNFSTDPGKNALVFSVTDLTCLFRTKEFSLKKFVTAKGSAEVWMMKNVAITVNL